MESLEANQENFESLNTVAVGLSVDSVPCKKAWAESLGIKNTRLLSDFWPHGGVARMAGVFREQDGVAHRSNIIIDEEGKVTFSKIYPMSQVPDVQEILGVLENLSLKKS